MSKLTHIDGEGQAHMVDVSAKAPTERSATAEGFVRMASETLALIAENKVAKGDVLATARLAGIMAAKRTGELIPLCHPLSLSGIDVDCALVRESHSVAVTTQVVASDRTGVEMEALVAASVAALTIYDMLKSIDRAMVIENTRLVSKTGGKSGDFAA